MQERERGKTQEGGNTCNETILIIVKEVCVVKKISRKKQKEKVANGWVKNYMLLLNGKKVLTV